MIAIAMCFAGTASFSQCQPAGVTELTQSQIDVLSACIKAVEAENKRLESKLLETQSRLSALSNIVQDLVDDDGLAKANNRINGLELRLGGANEPTQQVKANVIPAIGDDLATRAVVAFTSAKGERTCPPGWKPFEEAKDRLILGAGNKYQVVGSTGGEETVKLEERHMPAHDHGGSTGDQEKVPFLYNAPGDFTLAYDASGAPDVYGNNNHRFHQHPIARSGGDQPHENMPPWIALYYCIKE